MVLYGSKAGVSSKGILEPLKHLLLFFPPDEPYFFAGQEIKVCGVLAKIWHKVLIVACQPQKTP